MARLAIIIFLIFCPFLIKVTRGSVKNYTCEYSIFTKDTNICYLKHLNVTSSEKLFRLVPRQPVREIEVLVIWSSKVAVLTSDICETLRYLKIFRIPSVGLTSVEADAFQKCPHLKEIDLGLNYLSSLPSGIFDWNERLELVYLHTNKFTTIDEKVFKYNKNLVMVRLYNNNLHCLPSNLFENTPKLNFLDLGKNQLRLLSFLEEGMSVLESVSKVYLDHNKLSDVDEQKVIKTFPDLETIWLEGNNFWCNRRQTIEYFLKQQGVVRVILGNCLEDKKFWELRKDEINLKVSPKDLQE